MNEDRVRELRLTALLSAPALLTAGHGFHLFDIEANPNPSMPPPLPTNLVFGKKMERLFSHYLQYSNRYSLVAEGLQIVDNKTTIGELDFIVKDEISGELIHMEMACKFYLYRTELSENPMECWIGPNGRDRLTDKLEKLRNRQFPLIHHPLATEALAKLGYTTKNIVQQLYLPGMLFIPMKMQNTPPGINPDAVNGHWLRQDEFESTDFENTRFAIPTKENWLLNPSLCTEWISEKKARSEIGKSLASRRSPMVWLKSGESQYKRFFVLWW